MAFRAVSYFNKMVVNWNWSPSVNGIVIIWTARLLHVRLSHEFKRLHKRSHDRRYGQRNVPQVNQVVPQHQQFERNNENHHLFTLYFNNVSYVITHPQLKSFFSKFGPISRLYLVPNHQRGHHKGLGWVTFHARRSRDNCYYFLRNSTERMLGRKIYVESVKRRPRVVRVLFWRSFTNCYS